MPVVVVVRERGTRVRPSAPLLLVRAESKPISHRLLPESPGVSSSVSIHHGNSETSTVGKCLTTFSASFLC